MMDVKEKAEKIKWIIFDVDGVLTDGKIIIGNQGELCKSFDAHDGFGIALLRLSGVRSAIITGRTSEIVKARGRELNIDEIIQGETDKVKAMLRLKEKYDLQTEQIAFVGDDLMDIPLMRGVGLALAVDNAAREVKSAAHYVTAKRGGDGGVREIAEMILKAKGKWDGIVSSYLEQKPLKDIAQ